MEPLLTVFGVAVMASLLIGLRINRTPRDRSPEEDPLRALILDWSGQEVAE